MWAGPQKRTRDEATVVGRSCLWLNAPTGGGLWARKPPMAGMERPRRKADESGPVGLVKRTRPAGKKPVNSPLNRAARCPRSVDSVTHVTADKFLWKSRVRSAS